MGKGDKKSKRGKIVSGTYGVRRRRRKKTSRPVTTATTDTVKQKDKLKPVEEEVTAVAAPAPVEEVIPSPEPVREEVKVEEPAQKPPKKGKVAEKPVVTAEEPVSKPVPKKTTKKTESKAGTTTKKKPKTDAGDAKNPA
jgi:30S ribosomal protein S31